MLTLPTLSPDDGDALDSALDCSQSFEFLILDGVGMDRILGIHNRDVVLLNRLDRPVGSPDGFVIIHYC